jgi:hypothetical protein
MPTLTLKSLRVTSPDLTRQSDSFSPHIMAAQSQPLSHQLNPPREGHLEAVVLADLGKRPNPEEISQPGWPK